MKFTNILSVSVALAGSVAALPQRNSASLARLLSGNTGNRANSAKANSAASQNNIQSSGNNGNGGNGNGNGNGNNAGATTGQNAASGQSAANGQGGGNGQAQLSTATDGSTIVDMTVNINNLPIRFKVSAPADQFLASSGVPGASAASAASANSSSSAGAGAAGSMGLNVLLHGDGGQSFFDFPNQAVQGNLMGVVALAPNPEMFWGGGSGLDRVDGVPHSAAVNSLIQDVLPQMVAFDPAQVFFTGVSGGSLMLSGFFVPAFMSSYRTGVELNCGALRPQVQFVDAAQTLAQTRMHFQSTQFELAEVQGELPFAIKAYEQLAGQGAANAQDGAALMTVDNSPVGGHCEFDGQDFVSGVQLMSDNYATVMQGGDGNVAGIGVVTNSVVGNEDLQFSGAS